MSGEALQIVQKSTEMKGKGERERHTQVNAEFHRRTRRDKNAFLNEQHEEIEENIRMGKTRDLFKKIRDAKGTFHAKMGLQDRNGYGPNKQKILRRTSKNTQKNCIEKVLMIQITTMV